jgi:hypothetical protein
MGADGSMSVAPGNQVVPRAGSDNPRHAQRIDAQRALAAMLRAADESPDRSFRQTAAFQGQYSHWQRYSRGTPALDLAPAIFVNCLQNHDQAAQFGPRPSRSPADVSGKWRAMTRCCCLVPRRQCCSKVRKSVNEAVRRGRCEFRVARVRPTDPLAPAAPDLRAAT